jgi:hypothetical protein
LHFVAVFQVASLLSIGVDNEKSGGTKQKMGTDNKKALELDNRIVKSYFGLISALNKLLKNATKHPVA